MNTKIKVVVAVFALILILLAVFFIRGDEDSWIKDERGVWITHGNPGSIPSYVALQREAINKSLWLFEQRSLVLDLNSQCLGVIYVNETGFAVDIVHNPRIPEDNLPENQCKDYREGIVRNFIELDKSGTLIKIQQN